MELRTEKAKEASVATATKAAGTRFWRLPAQEAREVAVNLGRRRVRLPRLAAPHHRSSGASTALPLCIKTAVAHTTVIGAPRHPDTNDELGLIYQAEDDWDMGDEGKRRIRRKRPTTTTGACSGRRRWTRRDVDTIQARSRCGEP